MSIRRLAVSLAALSMVLASPVAGQGTTPSFPWATFVESRCVIEVERVSSDSFRASVLPSAECAPLKVELLPLSLHSPRQAYGTEYPTIRLAFVVRNVGAADVRSPVWAYSSSRDLEGFQRGAPIPPGFEPGARFVWSASGERDAPGMWLPSGQGMEMSWTLGGPDTASSLPQVIAPGGTTRDRVARLWVDAFVERYLVPIRLRALRPAPPIPQQPPDSTPAWLATAPTLPAGLDAPVAFLRDVIVLRFAARATPAARQMVVDRLGGVVVGGRAAVGDYYVLVDDSADGAPLFAALRRARPDSNRAIQRSGVYLVPSEVTRRLRARHPTPSPVLSSGFSEGPDSSVVVFFAGDATREEREQAARLVGGWLAEEDTGYLHLGWVRVGKHVGADSLAHATLRLRHLPAVDEAFVNLRRAASIESQYREPRPSLDTSSTVDPDVRRFVRGYHLPEQQAIVEPVRIPEHRLVLFDVAYGPGQDCALDCFYSTAAGLKYGDRIGWIGVSDYSRDTAAVTPLQRDTFTVEPGERYLFSDELEAAFVAARPDPWERSKLWEQLVLRMLVGSPQMPRERLLGYARSLYRAPSFYLAEDLAAVATARRDVWLLTLLASAPVEPQPVAATRQALVAMAPALVADSATPAATLFALADEMRISAGPRDLTDQLAEHPNARSNVAILAVLAEWSPRARERLLQIVRVPDRLRAPLSGMLAQAERSGALAFARQLMADSDAAANVDVLTVLANVFWPSAFLSDPDPCVWAWRRLPDSVLTRWGRRFTPPPGP